jgi:predicted DNA-binding transcriptional regulator YafY
MRGTQLARQWRILKLLETRKRGLSAEALSAELDAPIRTVYRDLKAIEEAGFPLYNAQIENRAYWRLMDGFKGGFPLPMTSTELMALHLSREILKVFDGSVFQESIESLFDKVRASLPPETFRYLEKISGSLKVGFGPLKKFRDVKQIIAEASDAAAKARQVEIVYRAASTKEVSSRRVDPYQVWAMNGSFYLIGLCHLRGAVRTFAMDRIKALTILDATFHRPKDFSLEDYLESAFRVMRGDPEVVEARFTARAAHVIRERVWHPTQEIRELDDGGLILTFEVAVNYEVISWMLGFGSAAEVLQPKSLRDRIIRELQAAEAMYRSQDGAQTKIIGKKKIPSGLT